MSSIPAIIMLLVTLSMLVYKDNYNGEGKLTDFFIEDATPKFPSDDLTELKSQVLSKGVSTMVVPTSLIESDEIRFSFVIDGNRFSVKNLSPITWEKGSQYIYTIRLSGTSLTISQVTIAKWETELADDLIIY